MKICFVFAMSAEAESLLSRATILEERSLGYSHLYRFSLEGKEAFACVSGVGKVLAGSSIASCACAYPEIDAFVNLGIGGSLNAQVAPVLSVVISSRFVQHDFDTTCFGDELGFLSGPNAVYLPADEGLASSIADACKSLGFPYCRGTMASGDQFITDEAVKEKIVKQFDALMIDMEAAAFAEVALGYGKPFVSIRVVSDAVDHQKEYWENKLPACEKVCQIGAELLRRMG